MPFGTQSPLNPFENPDPASLLSATHKGFLDSDDLALLRSQPYPGADARFASWSLGDAVTACVRDASTEPALLAWLDAFGIEPKPRSQAVHIDLTDGAPVAQLYHSKGFSHLSPYIRRDAGFIEFDESRAEGDVRVIVVFSLGGHTRVQTKR